MIFVFLPFMGGNSPAMDLMGVAAALQARCGCLGRRGPYTLPAGDSPRGWPAGRDHTTRPLVLQQLEDGANCLQPASVLAGSARAGAPPLPSRLPTAALCCVPAPCRGHSVTVVVTGSGLAFAKRAAARHSSNTTAEGMTYLQLNMAKQGSLEADIGDLIKVGQHPGRFSSEC